MLTAAEYQGDCARDALRHQASQPAAKCGVARKKAACVRPFFTAIGPFPFLAGVNCLK